MTSISQNLATITFLALISAAHAQEAGDHGGVLDQTPSCGEVSVAELNWASAEIFAHIDAIILGHGYGCDVELVPGDTMSTLRSMIGRAHPDISPETWINSARETLDQAVAARELHYVAPAFADGGVEGWWIPQYVAEANPEIETIADALEHPDLFPAPTDSSMGAVRNCPEGWSCHISTSNLFDAYNAREKGFKLVPAETGEELEASIAEAFANNEGWLGYYWAPTAALGRHDMVKLNFDAAYDEDEWNACIVDPDCPAPRVTAWPRSEVYTVVTDDFARRGDGALSYLDQRSLGNDVLNDLLAWKADNRASGEEAARHFLTTHENIWTAWVGPDAQQAIEDHLDHAPQAAR